MLIATAVLAGLAVLLHVYIWFLESFAWTTSARTVFGTTLAEAEATKELAFNQGFYNLFLAVTAGAGVIAWLAGSAPVGQALVLAGCGSMLAAALVLYLTSPGKRAAALKQGILPLAAVVLALLS